MKINFTIPFWVPLLLFAIIGILIYTNITSIRSRRAMISALDSTSTAFDTYRLTNEQKVSEQRATILTQEDAIVMGLIEQERLTELHIKSVDANVKLVERIEALKREAEFVNKPQIISRDTLYAEKDTTLRYMQIPTGIKYSDKWIDLYATVDYPISTFDTINVLSVPEITLGWQKQGVLQRPERTVFYTNENPYVTVVDMKNVIVEEPKKWYQTDWAKVTGGILGFEILRILLTGD